MNKYWACLFGRSDVLHLSNCIKTMYVLASRDDVDPEVIKRALYKEWGGNTYSIDEVFVRINPVFSFVGELEVWKYPTDFI